MPSDATILLPVAVAAPTCRSTLRPAISRRSASAVGTSALHLWVGLKGRRSEAEVVSMWGASDTIGIVIVIGLAVVALRDTRPITRVLGPRRSSVTRGLDYNPRRARTIEVPQSPDGRPGYTITAHSDSLYLGRINQDLSRSDFLVAVGPRATLNAVVLGPYAAHETPEESALYTVTAVSGIGKEIVRPLSHGDVAGEEAVGYAYRLDGRRTITEWKFKKDGWMFAVGVNRDEDDDESLRRAVACLASWRWTPAPPGQLGMPYTRDVHGRPLTLPPEETSPVSTEPE